MIILCGQSAVGKTEIAKNLAKKYGITKVVTTTTRPIRNGEVNDIDYHFVTKEKFLLLKEQDAFIETAEYNQNYYGCTKDEVRIDRVVILEPNGVKNFLKLKDPSIIVIVLTASEETRINRMISRGDKKEDIIKRIEGDKEHFKDLSFANHIIDTNDKDIDYIVDEIYQKYQENIKKARI